MVMVSQVYLDHEKQSFIHCIHSLWTRTTMQMLCYFTKQDFTKTTMPYDRFLPGSNMPKLLLMDQPFQYFSSHIHALASFQNWQASKYFIFCQSVAGLLLVQCTSHSLNEKYFPCCILCLCLLQVLYALTTLTHGLTCSASQFPLSSFQNYQQSKYLLRCSQFHF